MTPDSNNEITIDVSQRPDGKWMAYFTNGPAAGTPLGSRILRAEPWWDDECMWSWTSECEAWLNVLMAHDYFNMVWKPKDRRPFTGEELD